MNFEKLYEKYKAGQASEEEKIQVEAEIEKAKKISEILFSGNEKVELKDPDESEVKKAKKFLRIKTLIIALAASAAAILVTTGAVLGGVFGTAAAAAKKSVNYGYAEAADMAKEYVVANYDFDDMRFNIKDNDRDLHLKSPLKDSRYAYYVELVNSDGIEIEVSIDAKTGEVRFVDIDFD